jgi:hypothetical protein
VSISTQLGSVPIPQSSADLRALALAAGQNVEAKVLGQVPGGATQVAIGRQVLSLQLPAPQPPGTALTLSVQQSDGQIRLALIAVRPPSTGPVSTPAVPTAATSIQLSAAALTSQGPTPPFPATASAQANTGSAATPQPVPAQAAPPSGGPAIVSTAPTAMSALPPTTSAGTAPGQLAHVAAPAANGAGPRPAAPTQSAPAGAPQAPVTPNQPPAGQANGPTSTPVQAASATGPSTPQAGPLSGQSVASPPSPSTAPLRPTIPYSAAPLPAAAPNALLPGTTAAPSTQSQPVQQATASTQVGQHAPAPGGPVSAPAAVPPLVSASPQAMLHQMVHTAALRQDSILGLTAAMTAMAGKVALPEPVAKAMQHVLAQRLPLGAKVDVASLQKAVRMSGIFQEAMLATGQAGSAAGDLKTSLLGLQRQLLSWLGAQAPVEQVSSVPPPVRGQVPRAKANATAPRTIPLDPQEAGKVLLDRTEAALSRLRLHQHASLPEPSTRSDGAQWSLDLPVVVAGHQALLQMQIHRDAEQDKARPEDRGWQVRFAINLDEAGEVGAQISLRGTATGVLLWADRAEVADQLSAGVEQLRDELTALGLSPGAVIVRAGSPVQQAQPSSVSGHFLDETR